MDNEQLRERCDVLLLSLIGQKFVKLWWTTHNKAFDQTPEQQFDINPESVYNYLIKHTEGEW